ncbi:hypothetical protein HC823_00745 [Candidatus Gracilibacteria bacterium]|nr:hypothetical protein [Candidatus Gracilibacteria bacterium]
MEKEKLSALKKNLGRMCSHVLEYHRDGQTIPLFILTKVDFKKLENIRSELRKKPFIFLTDEDLKNGSDVFPLDFLHMKAHTQVILGKENPFEKVRIKKADLRQKLEYELRNKQIYLREEYLRIRNPYKFLPFILPTFDVLLTGLVSLAGKKLSEDFNQNGDKVSEWAGVNLDILKRLKKHEEEKTWKKIDKNEIPSMIQEVHNALLGLLAKVDTL